MPYLAANMPSSLRAAARWMRLSDADIPVMLVHPDWDSRREVPVALWMHGRTVEKEIDPGRYLRWMRAGIGACAIDLPGHGQRHQRDLHDPFRTLDVVLQMAGEIDSIVVALGELNSFDMNRLAIGGMSAGGMATMVRLCNEHPFTCASVEATSGSWEFQRRRAMFRDRSAEEIAAHNPIEHLDHWRELPFQAIHAEHDEWVDIAGQREFIEALRNRYSHPNLVELVTYEHTGAPHEHAGFGSHAADAKNRQRDFLRTWLLQET